MFAMLENLFWIAASAVLFLLLMIAVIGGCIEYKRLEGEKLVNPGKQEIAENELCFPEMSRFELEMAMLHARRTDKLLAKHRRNRYTGYRR